ncbi:MAG: hypothetical protein JXR94_04725 [Candidatus Hydrogenedentes bacterium]|nr:hypothetical protein [Candidatus Hydrogenedentota bacterium]
MNGRAVERIRDGIRACLRHSDTPGVDVAVTVSGQVVFREQFGVSDASTLVAPSL